MKKLLVVLLSLGLIVAFSTAASAVSGADVQFSGYFYTTGVYDKNPTVLENGYSRAAIYTETRVQTVFKIAEGLTLTTRFDALAKEWGDTNERSITAPDQDKTNTRTNRDNNNSYIQQNIEFEQAYVTFKTAIGVFDVGYQTADVWGTAFGNSTSSRPRVKFTTQAGPLTLLAIYEKAFEADISQVPGYVTATQRLADADQDNYFLAGIYSSKAIEAGLLMKYVSAKQTRVPAFGNYGTTATGFVPYFKGTFGPVYVEGEFGYLMGTMKSDVAGVADMDLKQWSAYLMARMNLGPAYFGLLGGWIQGDGDTATEVNNAGGSRGLEGGYDWKPTLILNNVSTGTWLRNGQDSGDSYKTNSKGYLIYGGFVGFNPTPKLNMEANLTFAKYDKKKSWNAARTAQTELIDDKIGTEIDLKATYKIYDNLTYMLGAGYLITGDAWKGNIGSTLQVDNTYLLINELRLTF